MPQSAPQYEPGNIALPVAMVRGIGALALFAALLVISVSVLGRHLNLPLPGSVEVVELLFVLVAASAMLYATVERSHAAARLILDRLPPGPRAVVEKLGILFGIVLWVAITVGNLWLLYDVWTLHEASPLLGIPIVPFRMIFTGATAVTLLVLAGQLRTKAETGR
ncbi:TRAP transporter small permease [Gilvimarinus sp. F26214L]|uniref:TRAP transporter small permease n=1 Tax=Gilvimarinus sp. DZF01 TaxID=3461371 RepID=UPI004045DFCB